MVMVSEEIRVGNTGGSVRRSGEGCLFLLFFGGESRQQSSASDNRNSTRPAISYHFHPSAHTPARLPPVFFFPPVASRRSEWIYEVSESSPMVPPEVHAPRHLRPPVRN